MKLFESIEAQGHEQVVTCYDKSSGYKGIIAIHDTTLGPALGGTRFWNYANDDEAFFDVLRLSRGMTYKNAVAGLNLGGGKAVIIGDPSKANREMIFRAHGRFVEMLGGRYVTAEDVNTSPSDMDYVHMETSYVAGLATKSGDPSPVTAHGVFRSIEASAQWRWGSSKLDGKKVIVQGLGHVGYYLCQELHAAGAKLVVADIRKEAVERVVKEFGAAATTDDGIYGAQADIFAPCALGAIVNDQTIPQLKVEIICGGSNNQLLEPKKHAEALAKKNILYAPDFVANAGGVINVYGEVAGWTRERALRKADEIFDTVLSIYQMAKDTGIHTYEAADRVAEKRLAAVAGLTRTWPQWPRKG
jgi:leucine dehydrogenase